MSNAKTSISRRFLAALLSFVLVLGLLPTSTLTAFAATAEHPDAITVSVTDQDGKALAGVTVAYSVSSTANGDDYASGTVTTDANGCVEVLTNDKYVANDLTLSATAELEGYTYADGSGEIENAAITSGTQDFSIQLRSTRIPGVTVVANSGLVYQAGKAQSLVTVAGVNEETDTVTYQIDDEVVDQPERENAGTYTVKVTVQREGYSNLLFSENVTIAKAEITDIDIEAVSTPYNKSAQDLVKLKGTFQDDELKNNGVHWFVNGSDTDSVDIPQETNVGEYKVRLTVDRGDNYVLFDKTVDSKIILGSIDLGSLEITANKLTYNGKEQEAIAVKNPGDYTLQYSFSENGPWTEYDKAKNSVPMVKDAGDYTVYIKAIKDSYNDKEYPDFPLNVHVEKAEQSFDFNNYTAMLNNEAPESIELKGAVPYEKTTYDFSAKDDAALAKGTITYEIVAEDGAAEIADNGTLTVNYPGSITVIARLSGNANYNECEIRYYLDITGSVSQEGQYIEFSEVPTSFVIGTSSVISEKGANKKYDRIGGNITHSINDVKGVAIDPASGKLTVTDIDKLVEEVQGGKNKIVVTAKKEEAQWYGADVVSYEITLSFETTPAEPYTLPKADGTNDWYKTTVTVTPADGYTVAQKASGDFAATTDFSDQGIETRFVYLKNSKTGGITDRIAVNVKIDTAVPTDLGIEFVKEPKQGFIRDIGELLGFYKPTVTINFTATDVTSGIDHFTWTYTPESGEPETRRIERKDITFDGAVATASITLPNEQAEEMHGKISFTATDMASNEIGKKDDYVFIIDTLPPKLSVKYQGEEPYTAQEGIYNGAHFFNSDVAVELTITETNFYSDDVVVKVSKDNGSATLVTPSWNDNVGTFTLAGDGDYKVYVSYTDKAENPMDDYVSDIVTVDKTDPIVKIDYIHNGDEQKTIFTVIEHNFRASDVTITGTMKDINNNDVAFTADQLTQILRNTNWSKNGDTYTTEYDAYVNGIYNLEISYTDIAGRPAKKTEQSVKEFTIDYGVPSDVTIEYAKTPMDTFLEVITLGFYNPSVTVRFTSYDTSSGVESFTWGYTKELGASTINHPNTLVERTISGSDGVHQDENDKSKFTAEITLTADEADQYRGFISVYATDAFKNESNKKDDKGNIFVVDTIAPTLKVEYSGADRNISGEGCFYNKSVDVKLTVTEANFYAEDVVVTVTKNGAAFDYGTVSWGKRNADDKSVGTFTLPAPADHSGDGNYIVSVAYADRSGNRVADEDGNEISYTDGGSTIYEYKSHLIIIDTIKPTIRVAYDETANKIDTLKDSDGNNRDYFNGEWKATVTIKEHNFNSDDVKFPIIGKDVAGRELDVNNLISVSDWKKEGDDTYSTEITYSGDANYTFDVEYSDLAGNAAEDYAADYFTVDTAAPKVTGVSYSTGILETVLSHITFGFYNAKMTVTITAEDETSGVHKLDYSYLTAAGVSTVNEQLLNQAIDEAAIKYSNGGKTAIMTFEIPKMVLGSDNQFNGTVEFDAIDRSGNKVKQSERKRIVVDNIAPTATVSYNTPTNEENNISYYDGDIHGTITINEANFYAEDVNVTVSKDGGAAQVLPTSWSDSSADTHIGTFTLTEDADYIVTINYRDKSGNAMAEYKSNQLTIDTKIEAPTYTINGMDKTGDNGGAYKDKANIRFNFEDQNFDTQTVKLVRTRFDETKDVTAEFVKVELEEKGGFGSFDIAKKVENDGIYVLTVTMTDKAGHSAESHVKFTINRYGSVYEYSDYLLSLIKDGGQYVAKNGDAAITEDLVITEYNADRIVRGSLKLVITRDGETIDTKFAANPEASDSTAIGSSGWYQYVYTISKDNFIEDGVYNITITSEDATGNTSTSVPDNSIDKNGDKILDVMTFTVDTTAPEIRNIVGLDKKIVNAQEQLVKYTIVDVGGLKQVDVVVNGQTVDTITDFGDDLNSFSGEFTLGESNDAQTVQIKVTDLAGNITDTASDDFNPGELYVFNDVITVSTNFFVRWYANTALFWGSIGGVVVVTAAIWILIAAKRKKKTEEK